jgi:anti-anti-sigma regulatory factor
MSTAKQPAKRGALARTKAPLKARRSSIAKRAKSAKAASTRVPVALSAPTIAKVALSPDTPARVAAAAKATGSARRPDAIKDVCRLSGSLVIRDARASLAQLCAALESGCTCVDVSGIDTIDTSGVQLLLAAAMEWRRREQPLRLTGYEHLVFGAAEQLGLQSLLPITAGVER